MQLPQMIEVENRWPVSPALDIPATLHDQFADRRILEKLAPGARVAVAVGSRGISNLREIVSAVIQLLHKAGAKPFIVPAMGSHGGATPEGQSEILAHYGITRESMGVPFDDRMDVRLIGRSANGVDVFFSEAALSAEGLIVINRVKPHTDFSGELGSGIQKMFAIGLGKQRGASAVHVAASRLGLEAVLRAVSAVGMRHTPVLGAVAIVEDQEHATAGLYVLRPENIVEEEGKLLVAARSLMPQLPFEEIDLLVVDFMGKNISGSGMDPNVIGRSVQGYSTSLVPGEVKHPRIFRIFVRELTPESNGNATGIGLADFTTARTIERIDREASYTNALTAVTPASVKLPIYFQSDRECIERAVASVALPEGTIPRIVRISSTLSLRKAEVSEAYAKDILANPALAVTRAAQPWTFDAAGNLAPM